jgi:hypothetical protein
MGHLITSDEVISYVFIGEEKVKSAHIKSSMIDVAEKRFIIPFIGQDMFDAIIGGSYTDILALLKPCLAFFVRYVVLPDLSISVTNMGMMSNHTDYSSSVTNEDKRVLRQSALDNGQSLLNSIIHYLNDNHDSYPEFEVKRKRVFSGIVL